jgi:hypothetical protein
MQCIHLSILLIPRSPSPPVDFLSINCFINEMSTGLRSSSLFGLRPWFPFLRRNLPAAGGHLPTTPLFSLMYLKQLKLRRHLPGDETPPRTACLLAIRTYRKTPKSAAVVARIAQPSPLRLTHPAQKNLAGAVAQ